MDAKAAGNYIYLVGETRHELGGSLLASLYDLTATTPPGLSLHALPTARALHQAIRRGTVRACHDLSEGGLAVAAAEMALAGGLGLSIDLEAVPVAANVDHPLITLFSESNTRWLVEVPPGKAAEFEQILQDCPAARCGQVTAEPILRIGAIEISINKLDERWREGSSA
jgi:phosphoribosylformylglycinamidine synthase